MVVGSFITAVITLGNPNLQVNVESQKLFMTALCFKLVQRSDSLNQLFTTMAYVYPDLQKRKHTHLFYIVHRLIKS